VRLKFATKSAPTTREPNIADTEENIIELGPISSTTSLARRAISWVTSKSKAL